MTHDEFKRVWLLMTEEERQAVKDKATWEHMSLWAVCNEWPSLGDAAVERARRPEGA